MNNSLAKVKSKVYDKCGFQLSEYIVEREGRAYDACQYSLNGKKIISRSGRITPKKVGQFVTFWKRNAQGVTRPFDDTEHIDFFIVNVKVGDRAGQLVFPTSALINYGIMSTATQEGKRGIRVYPPWDEAASKQAKATQQWQQDYFYEVNEVVDIGRVKEFYNLMA